MCYFCLVVSLFRKSKQQLRDQMSSRRPFLVKALEKIQDFYMELKWDFQSWGELNKIKKLTFRGWKCVTTNVPT